MPVLYVLAGPNGAGKTTFYDTYLKANIIEKSLSFLNVDLITKNELGTYTQVNFTRAEMIFRERIKLLIDNKNDFMIESNLAKETDYEWLEKMIVAGYEIILYFLCTDDLDIHYNRVKKRVKEGGHDVPENIVKHRYDIALSRLRSKIIIFKETYLIDSTYSSAKHDAYLQFGKIIYKEKNCPAWVNNVLFIVEKLHLKISKRN